MGIPTQAELDAGAAFPIPTLAVLEAMTPREVKTLETRLRRAAERQGLRLDKSRRRDPHALDYGTYQLVDIETGDPMPSPLETGYGLDLIDVAFALYGVDAGELMAHGIDLSAYGYERAES